MATPVLKMRTPAETALIERFGAEKSGLPGMAAERAEAFARFEADGLPSRRIEAYHYTDLRALVRAVPPRAMAANADIPAGVSAVLAGIDTTRIAIVDGAMRAPEALPAGMMLEPLGEALARGSVSPGASMGKAQDVVVDLNTAFARDGVVIRIAEGSVIETPVLIDCIATGKDAAFHARRVIVEVGAGAALTVFEGETSPENVAHQVNHVTEFRLGAGARVQHIRLNRAGRGALVLSNLAATLAADSELSSLGVSLGGETCRHQVFVTYAGENAKATIHGATMLNGSQHHDSTLVVDHASPHGTSRELFRSVIDGSAQGVFQGKIIVRPHAQKTDGQMASNALLLSDDSGMSNKPELEIFADDVVCAHGATCGALDDSQLFYLMARGLPRREAEALLVEAFIGEALEIVSHDSLRESLAGLVSDWMQARAVS